MPTKKIAIVDPQTGEILRTLTLPYNGILVDLSDMDDTEWETQIHKRIHEVEMEVHPVTKQVIKDTRGIPKLRLKKQI